MRRSILAIPPVLTCLGLMLCAGSVCADTGRQAIDRAATLASGGREVQVTGPVQCSAGELLFLRVTLNQRTTGATAEGHYHATCRGETQTWSVTLQRRGGSGLRAGPARACAMFSTIDGNRVTDVLQWCRDIDLEPQSLAEGGGAR